jgi:hypothetical protein
MDIEGGAFRTELHACFPRRADALFVDKDVPAGFQAIRVAGRRVVAALCQARVRRS